MEYYSKDATVIIRSAGERTEKVCEKLILEQGIQERDLAVVKEEPFSKAMKVSFEHGIKQGKKWTFCIDADVLLRKGAIQKMIELAESQPERVCEIQGLVLDKFFSGPREAGNHLYRTSLLNKVIDRIPGEGTDIRPETHALNRMKEDGYDWVSVPFIVGIHDDEQFNFDIYRKAFVHAVKHLHYADLLIPHWKKNSKSDQDFKVALQAFSDSIRNSDDVFINRSQNLYSDHFNQTGFDEKGVLDAELYSAEFIDEKIQNWQINDKYYDYFPNRLGMDTQADVFIRKVKSSYHSRGALKTAILTVSKGLEELGKKIGKRIPE
jgi:hypothetical protein